MRPYHCGSGTHTLEEQSAQNARRGFAEVVQGQNRVDAEFEMEEENGEAGDEVDNGEHRVIDTQAGPITQMRRETESQDIGGRGQEKTEEKVEKVEEEVAREVLGDWEESEESEDGDEGSDKEGKEGENKGNGGGKSKGGRGGRGEGQRGGNKVTVTLGRTVWVAPVRFLGSGVRGGFRPWALLPGGSMEEARERGMRVLGAWSHRWPALSFLQERCQRGRERVKGG